MNTKIALLSAALAAGTFAQTAQAGHGSDDILAGAIVGAVAGGIIGNNSRHSSTWEGAAIGAVAGGVLGAIVSDHNRSTVVHVSDRGHGGRRDDCRDDRDRWDRHDSRYDRDYRSGRDSWNERDYRSRDRYDRYDDRRGRTEVRVVPSCPPPRHGSGNVVIINPPSRPRDTRIIEVGPRNNSVIIIDESRRRSCDTKTVIIRR